MFAGSPRRNAAMFSETMSTTRWRDSTRCQPMCGVSITLSRPYNGWSAGRHGGGAEPSPKTSSAAPAMFLSESAATSAAWSTMAPRAVLTRNAVGFMRASSRAPTRPRVASLKGQWMDTKSASANKSSSAMTTTPSSSSPGAADDDATTTRMPSATPIFATSRPMRPRPPTRPSVLPVSSTCGSAPRCDCSRTDRSPFPNATPWRQSEHASAITSVMAMCAMACVAYVGTLATWMSFDRHVARCMLL
mmetsp:Transcript_3187/g.9745  ORF Transcript_3187/g.9745 Transcript_3187/m.9745 type:complete len:247 (+) Transcript_3187:81-821(+)